MLGKSNGHKNGGISTKEVWQAIHRVSDIRASASDLEHQIRVFNHENTPWIPDKSKF